MFNAILLAGGLSTRMGSDKKQLEFQGQTLLEHSLELLISLGPEMVLLSGAQHADAIYVPDVLTATGPPGGIFSCLHYLKQANALDNTPLIIIPVDMPLLNKELLLKLLDAMEGKLACRYENEIFPCVIRAKEELYNFLQEAFSEGTEKGGKRSMRSIFRFLEIKSIPYQGDPELFANINHPQDWARLTSL